MKRPKIFGKGNTSINAINLNSIGDRKSVKDLKNEINIYKQLLTSFLEGSGYADIQFLADELLIIEKLQIISNIIDVIDGSFEYMKDAEVIDFNNLIYYIYDYVVHSINDKYNIELESGENIENSPNALASRLVLFDGWEEGFPDLSKEDIKEIESIFDKIG
jgi:hypothetical protein